ncbi:MAG: hypothetical protein IKP68_08035 [Clostridia bacterium]|nr:hypothetical protein [Clostridia bacterium]
MHDFKKLESMICKELDEATASGKLGSSAVVDYVHKLVDTVKNIKKIEMLEGEDEGEYSRRYMRDIGPSSRRSYFADDEMHRASRDDGYSYRRRRDSMGRYADGDSHDHIIARIGEMMSIASTDEDRRAIEDCLRKLQQR